MLLSSCSWFGNDHEDDEDQSDVENGDGTGDGTNDGTGDGTGDEGDDPTPPCSHAQTQLVGKKDPTCAEKGYTGDSVCLACAAVVVKGSEINTIDHSYDTGKVTKAPTCIETGVKTFTCTGCGTTKTEAVETVAHSDVYHNAEDGTHFHTCRTCTLNENKQHTPVDEGVAYAASCLEPAYVEFVCSDCNGVYKVYDETQPAIGHDFGTWNESKHPTCKAGGLKTQTCQREGCGVSNNIDLPKNESCNMVFAYYEPAPTCVQAGVAVYRCTDCGKEETKPVNATGVHSYEAQEDKGDGWTHKVCTSCGDTISSFNASTQISADLTAGSIDKSQALEMDMEKATIQFPTNVVGQIAADESKDVSISADEADTAKTEAAIEKIADTAVKEAIAGATVYDFTVTVGDTVFTDKFDTKVAITMPYTDEVTDAEGIIIYYLAEDGTIETITDVVYDAMNQTVTFFVEHFSFYAVAFRETQEMRCRRGLHDYAATGESVTASCHSFGYTVWECTCCHTKTVDNIVERLPHNYGELIEAKPTCSSGDYSHKICQNDGCGDILLIQFKGATGHTIDAPATCTTPSTCTKCQNVVYRALGHAWTEWEIVVKPTEVTNGLRRRHCETCGIFEEITLAATGNIDTITYNSYGDIINLIFEKVLKIKNGSISFELTDASNNKYTASIKARKNENGYTLLMSVPGVIIHDAQSEVVNAVVYFHNGVFVADVPDEGIYSSTIDGVSNIPIDIFKGVLEDIHAELNYYVENYLKTARVIFAEYSPIVAKEVDAILAAAGSEFTVAKIEDLIDSLETVYAYMSLKLGYATNAEIIEGITLPEVQDFETIVSAFTALSEAEDGSKTYTYDLSKLIDATNTAVDWLEEKSADTVAEFIYGLIGEKIAEINETIVDFDALVAWIKAEIPGTLTVADAVDKLLTVLEENEIVTIDSIYNLIDELAYKITGNNFNSKAYIVENGSATLNDFAGMVTRNPEVTLDMLYDMLAEMANEMTVGDLGYQGVTVSYAAEYAKGMLEAIQLVGGFNFKFDKDGNFVSFELNEDFKMATGTDEETGETVYQSFEKAAMSIVRDDNVVIEMPEHFGTAILDFKTSYDSEGNLIIEGLDDSFDLQFYISGSGEYDLDDILKVDDKLTAELGYTVYVIDAKFFRDGKYTETYYRIDGKYYTAKHVSLSSGKLDMDLTVNLTEIFADPMAYLPDAASEHDGYIHSRYDDTLTPAWNIGVGIVHQEMGEWMISQSYGISDLNDDGKPVYYMGRTVSYSEFAINARISSINNSYYYNYEYAEIDGEKYKVVSVNYYVDGSGETVSDQCIIKDNQIYLVEYDEKNSASGYYELTEISALPDRSGYKVNEYNRTEMNVSDGNGGVKEVDARVYEYSVPTPVYFVKIADGLYTELDNYWYASNADRLPDYVSDDIYVGNFETMLLPDGNTLYIKGRDYESDKDGNTVVYGYAKTSDGLYIQTICRINGENIVGVEYREVTDTYYASFGEIYDINNYMTKLANGKYKISKALLDELKSSCTEPDSGYYLQVVADRTVNGYHYSNGYRFNCYHVAPEVSLGDIFGGFGGMHDAENYWERYFGSDGGYNDYQFNLNEDGSLTIYFENGIVINNINYYFGNRLPVDTDKLVKDDSGKWGGLDVYKLELTKDWSSTDHYVYKNGKYYHYTTPSNYEFDIVADPFASWYVSGMSYQFDTVAAEGMEEGIPVYNTTISFREYMNPFDGPYSVNVYTFIIDGEIYVAQQATQIGESILQFEGYVKLNDYMDSLVFVKNTDECNTAYAALYVEGKLTTIGSELYTVYETDSEGNRFYVGEIKLYYVTENGVKNYIYDDTHVNNMVIIGDEYVIPAGKYEDIILATESFYNENVTIATCRYVVTEKATQYFVKLAGKFYRYEEYGCHCYELWYGRGCYWCASIGEDEFRDTSLDKVWYYELVDEYENVYGYYSKFSIGENGLIPENQVFEHPDGEKINRAFLGYTADGRMLYEISFYVQSAAGKNYTAETQADGTVFYHVDGIGYLKDQSGRYVPAYKMLNSKGEYEIVCRIHSAYISEKYVNYAGVLDAYVDFSIGGSYVTFSPDLLEVAEANRSQFKIQIYTNSSEVEIGYDLLDALFNGKTNDEYPEGGMENPDKYPEGGMENPDEYPEGGVENPGDKQPTDEEEDYETELKK